MTTILAIETSCDETSAAVVHEGRWVRSNVIASQADLHARYGGVVPELASRQHITAIIPVVQEALEIAWVKNGGGGDAWCDAYERVTDDVGHIPTWNDEEGRTKEEVVSKLRELADSG